MAGLRSSCSVSVVALHLSGDIMGGCLAAFLLLWLPLNAMRAMGYATQPGLARDGTVCEREWLGWGLWPGVTKSLPDRDGQGSAANAGKTGWSRLGKRLARRRRQRLQKRCSCSWGWKGTVGA